MENNNTGNCSTGDRSTGDRSTGNWSTGNRSTGSLSTGDCSTGSRSTGDFSTGDFPTGNWSTGDFSTGNWSTSNYSSGHFSTVDFSGFGCFDKPCTLAEWRNSDKPYCLYFELTEWREDESLPAGGELIVHDYKKAFTASMEKASKEEIEMVKALPNFDAQKFYEISGFMIKETKTITIDGKNIEISVEEFDSIKKQLLEK